MHNLVLIGGGHTSIDDKSYETLAIDREIVRMAKVDKPVFLFIGLASDHSDSKYDDMKKIYRDLECETIYLKKKNIINNPNIVVDKINRANIIYMCGGDTKKLVDTIREYGIDTLLREAYERGTVIAGLSAGAIAISQKGLSDYEITNDISSHYTFTEGLGLVDLTICPHGDDQERITDLKHLLKDAHEEVIIIENGAALKIVDDQYEMISSQSGAKVYSAHFEKDKWILKELK